MQPVSASPHIREAIASAGARTCATTARVGQSHGTAAWAWDLPPPTLVDKASHAWEGAWELTWDLRKSLPVSFGISISVSIY